MPNLNTSIQSVNCETKQYDGRIIISAGSGAIRFVQEYDRENKSHTSKTTFQEMSARLLMMYQKEIEDPHAYYYKFGVAYEIATTRSEIWQKLPYCFALFGHNKKHFGLKKLLSTSYHNETLAITTSLFEIEANTTDKSKWIFLANKVPWLANYISLIESDHSITALYEDIVGDFESGHTRGQQEPIFSAALIEIHPRNGTGQVKFDRISNFPAAIGVILKKGGFRLASKAFFRRNVEEHFLGRKFIPPDNLKEFYYKNREELTGSAKLSYDEEAP